MKRFYPVILLFLLLLPSLYDIHAQDGTLPASAAVHDRTLRLYNLGGGAQIMTEGALPFDDLTWSTNGEHLAFVYYTEDLSARLMLSDRNGTAPVELAQDVASLPPTFTTSGDEIIYTSGDNGTVRVLAQALNPDATPREIATIGFSTDCGGSGSPYIMDAVYTIETGFNGGALLFQNTSVGVVHSVNCAGEGVALLDLESGESRILAGGLSRAHISTDGTQILGIENGRTIVAVDLSSGARRSFNPTQAPSQVAWGLDGSTVYYSVRTLLDEPLPLSDEETQILSAWTGISDFSIPQYTVRIYRANLDGGDSTQLYSGPGWAVGRIFPTAQGVYFSLIPNGEDWVEALTTGQIDPNAPAGFAQERATAAPAILLVPAGGGEAVEIATDISQLAPLP